MFRIALVILALLSVQIHASGFKINEQSLRSIALSSAYVAAAYGADSSYFNPANMGFLDGIRKDKHDLEVSLTAIYIPGFNFTTDTRTKQIGEGSINWGLTSSTYMGYLQNDGSMKPPIDDTLAAVAKFFGINGLDTLKNPIVVQHAVPNQHGTFGYSANGAMVDGSADTTIFPVPKVFYKSESFLNYGGGGFNAGLAFTAPSGLAMTWNGEAGDFLKDVMIAILELSPAISYQFREIISIGFSPRILYGMGNFNNTVYVPLQGDVLLKLQDFDSIPDALIPPVMKELIDNINNAQNMGGFAGFFVGGGAHWNNRERYNNPTLFNPERWFGLPNVGTLGDYKKIAEYNKRVDSANAIMKENWNFYQNEWKNGNLSWKYNDKTCANEDTICLPTYFNPVPYRTYKTTLPNGKEATGFKFVNGVNYCINNRNGWSVFFGCQNMNYSELDRLKNELGVNSLYVNCYTGTVYNFDGSPQTGDPGPCNYPNPTEKDENGAPRGYKHLWGAKEVANAFGMGDMDIKTILQGSTKVEQRSNGADLAFGYRAGITYRPINTKNYALSASVVFDSPVKFKFKGKLDADTYIGDPIGDVNMKADLALETQLPAQLKVGIAQRIYNLTIEFVYEKIWWSGGKKFDFSFSNPTFTALNPDSLVAQLIKAGKIDSMMDMANYNAVAMGNGWKDTNAYRLGFTYRMDNGITMMWSVAYDESPVPQEQIGIPDSTAYIVGGGINFPVTENLTLGASATMYLKDGSKSIYQSGDLGRLILANLSMGYSF
ncbi:outer membrane protein transport protein [Helicobacter sp. 23-1045]